ncbi:hypothetical protein Tco_1499272 [Tanacetum coccineum]
MPRDCLRIIESKSKVRNSRNKPVVAKVSSSSSTPGISPDVAELKDIGESLTVLDKKNHITQAPATPSQSGARKVWTTVPFLLITGRPKLQPPVVQVQPQVPNSKPVVDPVSASDA